MKTAEEEDKTEAFGELKWRVGCILAEQFLKWNDGKFNTAIELNPATHALTEFVESYSDQQLAEFKTKLKDAILAHERLHGTLNYPDPIIELIDQL